MKHRKDDCFSLRHQPYYDINFIDYIDYIIIFQPFNRKETSLDLTELAFLARNIEYTHGHRCVQYDKHLQSCFQCRAAE